MRGGLWCTITPSAPLGELLWHICEADTAVEVLRPIVVATYYSDIVHKLSSAQPLLLALPRCNLSATTLTPLQGERAPRIVVATYFGDIVHNLDVVDAALRGVHGLHVDLVRHPEQLDAVVQHLGPLQVCSYIHS